MMDSTTNELQGGWSLDRSGLKVSGKAGFELALMFTDKKHGRWLRIKAGREEMEIRITCGGYLRPSKPRKAR